MDERVTDPPRVGLPDRRVVRAVLPHDGIMSEKTAFRRLQDRIEQLESKGFDDVDEIGVSEEFYEQLRREAKSLVFSSSGPDDEVLIGLGSDDVVPRYRGYEIVVEKSMEGDRIEGEEFGLNPELESIDHLERTRCALWVNTGSNGKLLLGRFKRKEDAQRVKEAMSEREADQIMPSLKIRELSDG